MFAAVLIAAALVSQNAFAQNLKVNDTLAYGQRSKNPFFVQNTLVNVTNTSVKTVVASVVIPGGTMGSNGVIRVTFIGDADANNANSKFFILDFGGSTFKQANLSGNKSIGAQWYIVNRNDPASNVSTTLTAAASYGLATAMPQTRTVNTAVDQTLTLSITNVVSTDSMNLQSFEVSIISTL